MSSHFRHCPKHRKPLPCGHCASVSGLPEKRATSQTTCVRKEKPDLSTHYCMQHGQRLPCYVCERNQQDASVRRAWLEVAEANGIRPEDKCVHGHYLAEYYCNVCAWKAISPGYDTDTYREEIRKALGAAKQSMYGDEGRKNFRDLVQLVDIEMWKAVAKYGTRMNQALAFSVAKNTANSFTQRLIAHPAGITGTPRDTAPPILSFNKKFTDEDGDELSAAEREIAREDAREIPRSEDIPVVALEDIMPALCELVATWHGAKRLVAEAMLKPGFTVRSVSGVPKSTASRLYGIVTREFKSLQDSGLQK